jgi:purine-nucleoside phosphorylase
MHVDTARASASPSLVSAMDASQPKSPALLDPQEMAAQSRELIRRSAKIVPTTAIVLGTGLGDLADQLDEAISIDYCDLPGFPQPTALAHRGQLVIGKLQRSPIIALQGRCHLYEGRSPFEITFPIRVLATLGVKTLFLTNAAGGLQSRFTAGDVMAIEDHINLMFQNVLDLEPRPMAEALSVSIGTIYDPQLLDMARQVALETNVTLQQGVYVGVTGPNYETRAEYRMMRRLGGDAVGMSTVLEALFARQLGLRVAGFSAITNVARPDAPDVVDAEVVVDVAEMVAPKIISLLKGMLSRISPPTRVDR